MKFRPAALLVVALLYAAGACSHGEESECAKYVAILGGDNPSSAFKFIGENKCQDSLDKLNELFSDQGGSHNVEIIRLAISIWDPKGDPNDRALQMEAEKFAAKRKLYVELMKKGLQHPETAVLAASAVSDWNLTELTPDLVKMVQDDLERSTPRFVKAYLNAVTAILRSPPEAEHADMYVKLVSTTHDEPDYIEVNRMAAKALGELKVSTPEAIKALIKGLFLVSKDGRHIITDCISALTKVGPPAVPYLVAVLSSSPGDEAVRYMEEFAIPNAISDWLWRRGDRIPRVLVRIRDQASGLPLLKDLTRPIVQPAGLSPELMETWTITQANRMKFEQAALMSVGEGPGFQMTALKAMRDPKVPVEARLDLALALAFQQTPESAETLFKVIFEEEVDDEDDYENEVAVQPAKPAEKPAEKGAKPEAKPAAKPAVKDVKLPPPAIQADFVINFALPLVYSMQYKDLDMYNRIFDADFDELFGDVGDFELIPERLKREDVKTLLTVIKVGQTSFKKYMAIFKGQQQKGEGDLEFNPASIKDKFYVYMARTKAALVLSRWKVGSKQKAELLQVAFDSYKNLVYKPDFDDFRRALLLLMERQGAGDADLIKNLEEFLVEENKKLEKNERHPAGFWNPQIEALTYFLKRGKKGK